MTYIFRTDDVVWFVLLSIEVWGAYVFGSLHFLLSTRIWHISWAPWHGTSKRGNLETAFNSFQLGLQGFYINQVWEQIFKLGPPFLFAQLWGWCPTSAAICSTSASHLTCRSCTVIQHRLDMAHQMPKSRMKTATFLQQRDRCRLTISWQGNHRYVMDMSNAHFSCSGKMVRIDQEGF